MSQGAEHVVDAEMRSGMSSKCAWILGLGAVALFQDLTGGGDDCS